MLLESVALLLDTIADRGVGVYLRECQRAVVQVASGSDVATVMVLTAAARHAHPEDCDHGAPSRGVLVSLVSLVGETLEANRLRIAEVLETGEVSFPRLQHQISSSDALPDVRRIAGAVLDAAEIELPIERAAL